MPDDLSVVGFGDNLISMLSVPRLTTINQHAVKIGERSAELLVNRINEKSSNNSFTTEIISTSTSEGCSK